MVGYKSNSEVLSQTQYDLRKLQSSLKRINRRFKRMDRRFLSVFTDYGNLTTKNQNSFSAAAKVLIPTIDRAIEEISRFFVEFPLPDGSSRGGSNSLDGDLAKMKQLNDSLYLVYWFFSTTDDNTVDLRDTLEVKGRRTGAEISGIVLQVRKNLISCLSLSEDKGKDRERSEKELREEAKSLFGLNVLYEEQRELCKLGGATLLAAGKLGVGFPGFLESLVNRKKEVMIYKAAEKFNEDMKGIVQRLKSDEYRHPGERDRERHELSIMVTYCEEHYQWACASGREFSEEIEKVNKQDGGWVDRSFDPRKAPDFASFYIEMRSNDIPKYTQKETDANIKIIEGALYGKINDSPSTGGFGEGGGTTKMFPDDSSPRRGHDPLAVPKTQGEPGFLPNPNRAAGYQP